MDLKLSFYGAAENVTGSRYLLEANGTRVMIDCGMYQERKLRDRNWDAFQVPPASIDAILLTHGHLDHCGLIPRLVNQGFNGPIYCTSPTADIAAIIMQDSAKIQEEDVRHKKKRHAREGRQSPRPLAPLYTIDDAKKAIPLFKETPYENTVEIAPGLTATFHNAGHILGSSSVRIVATQDGESRSILFSGDIGRWDIPIICDPTPIEQADYVITESTYGDRLHEAVASIPGELERIINETRQRGGNIIIPSFAVERSQELLYHLSGLVAEKRIPRLAVFLDSPMAVRVTDVFLRHPHFFDDETIDLLRRGKHPCDFPGLTMSKTVDQSKAINEIQGTVIVIAGSGMCTGGRIKHHLVSNIERESSTILFVGYQAVGTLGRIILDGEKRVRILGEEREVKASIERIQGFSAHADRDEIFRWMSSFKSAPRHVFVTHGEAESAASFASWLHEKTDWATSVPKYEQTVVLD